jgi:hypothetical protein
MTCETCGLPEGALTTEGRSLTITRRAENGFKRDTKVTVWCCSEDCAIMAEGVSRYGPSASKWPITLPQLKAEMRKHGVQTR